jgi:sugar/nucleoside kinase (ribokinase family)
MRSEQPDAVDIVCLGILVADVIARPVDAAPSSGALGFVDTIALHPGGCALNTAAALAALGLRAGVAGKVGADAFGDFLLRVLDERGISREGVLRDETVPTSATVALVDSTGERTFLHAPGANSVVHADELDPRVLYRGRALHLGGALVLERLDGTPLADIAAEAQRRGLLTSLVPVWDPTGRWSRLEPSLPHLDLASMSLAEGRAVSGEDEPAHVAHWLRERGVGQVTLTMGAQGCYTSGDGFDGFVPAPAVDAVDGTGAGDAFAAGLVYARFHGWPLERAARLACALGALSTLTMGAPLAQQGLEDALALAELD